MEDSLPSIPEAISDVSTLTLFAKRTVEGTLSGLHRSDQFGSSVEFAEHKLYSPGDDLRRIDWKVLGRKDKFYLKRFEEETNARAYVLLDASASMSFGSIGYSKLDFARVVGACLSYLLISQQDLVGFLAFGQGEPQYIPPRGRMPHFQRLMESFLALKGEGTENLERAFAFLRERIHRQGIVFVISDFLTPMDRLKSMARIFTSGQHDIHWLHVLDPAEIEFPFEGWCRFQGLEGEAPLDTHGREARRRYQKEIARWMEELKAIASLQGIHSHLLRTDVSMVRAMTQVFG